MVGDIKKETSPKAVKTLLERLVEKVIVKKKEFSVAPKIVHSKGNALALPLICTTFTKKENRAYLGVFYFFMPRMQLYHTLYKKGEINHEKDL